MHVRCHLRAIRERMPRKEDGTAVSLRDIEAVAGVSPGVLSQIERGVMLPPDRQIAQLEAAYGAAVTDWYAPAVLLVLQEDEPARARMSAQESIETTRAPWLDDMDDSDFCHIGRDASLCGAPTNDENEHGDYDGEAICPSCGRPTCPRCAQLTDLDFRMWSA